MVKKYIRFTSYEINNINLMIHIGKENGLLVSQQSKKEVLVYGVSEEAVDRFISEWDKAFTELFIFCERYKMLQLPHLRIARLDKMQTMIKNYCLDNKYRNDFIQVIKEIKDET